MAHSRASSIGIKLVFRQTIKLMNLENHEPPLEKESSPLSRLTSLVAEKRQQVADHFGDLNGQIQTVLRGLGQKPENRRVSAPQLG